MSLTTRPPSAALRDHQDAASRARAALVGLARTLVGEHIERAISDMCDAARDLEAWADSLSEMRDEAGEWIAACTCGAAELGGEA